MAQCMHAFGFTMLLYHNSPQVKFTDFAADARCDWSSLSCTVVVIIELRSFIQWQLLTFVQHLLRFRSLSYNWYRNVQASDPTTVPEAPTLSLLLYSPSFPASNNLKNNTLYVIWVSGQRREQLEKVAS